jgi:hypothetical protein
LQRGIADSSCLLLGTGVESCFLPGHMSTESLGELSAHWIQKAAADVAIAGGTDEPHFLTEKILRILSNSEQ